MPAALSLAPPAAGPTLRPDWGSTAALRRAYRVAAATASDAPSLAPAGPGVRFELPEAGAPFVDAPAAGAAIRASTTALAATLRPHQALAREWFQRWAARAVAAPATSWAHLWIARVERDAQRLGAFGDDLMLFAVAAHAAQDMPGAAWWPLVHTAAAQEFGLPRYDVPADLWAVDGGDLPFWQTWLRLQYDLTQQWLQARAIPGAVIYRGMRGAAPPPWGRVTYQLSEWRPVASTTVAWRFACYYATGVSVVPRTWATVPRLQTVGGDTIIAVPFERAPYGYVQASYVPAADMLGVPWCSPASALHAEVLTLGRSRLTWGYGWGPGGGPPSERTFRAQATALAASCAS